MKEIKTGRIGELTYYAVEVEGDYFGNSTLENKIIAFEHEKQEGKLFVSGAELDNLGEIGWRKVLVDLVNRRSRGLEVIVLTPWEFKGNLDVEVIRRRWEVMKNERD